MAIWFTVNNALLESLRGRNYFANSETGAYKIVLVKGGTLNVTNATVGDFINCGTNTEANYTRPTLTGVFLDSNTAGKPMWNAANVNIIAATELNCNYAAIYTTWSGTLDGNSNIVCIANLGQQVVAAGTNLVLDLSAGIVQFDDPAT